MFKPGPDPRRQAGVSPVRREFQSLVKEHADEAVDVLMECVRAEDSSYKDKREAIQIMLGYAHGLPVARHIHAQVGGANPGIDTSKLSNEELLNLALNASENASEDPITPIMLDKATD